MVINELLSLCDDFDEYTKFYLYDIEEDYKCNGVEFAILNKYQLLTKFANSKVKKFYIHNGIVRVDVLFESECIV